MTAEELQYALSAQVPVIYRSRSMRGRKFEYVRISEIIFRTTSYKDKYLISCRLIDKTGSHTIANYYDIELKEKAEIKFDKLAIDTRLKNALKQKKPVYVKKSGQKRIDYDNITALILRFNENSGNIELYCLFEAKYKKPNEEKAKDVKVRRIKATNKKDGVT